MLLVAHACLRKLQARHIFVANVVLQTEESVATWLYDVCGGTSAGSTCQSAKELVQKTELQGKKIICKYVYKCIWACVKRWAGERGKVRRSRIPDTSCWSAGCKPATRDIRTVNNSRLRYLAARPNILRSQVAFSLDRSPVRSHILSGRDSALSALPMTAAFAHCSRVSVRHCRVENNEYVL